MLDNSQDFTLELLQKRLESLNKDIRYTRLKILIEMIITSFFVVSCTAFFSKIPYIFTLLLSVPWIINLSTWSWLALRYWLSNKAIVLGERARDVDPQDMWRVLWEEYRKNNFYWQSLRRDEFKVDIATAIQFFSVALLYISYILLSRLFW
ncbi:hypothetical protein [Calothrix sp. NIES-2098]|uniref:hypothetical protein n=1 Tax=Calothrix sp. NIES-2098 TaxID=1954171 RepID=UPI000B61A02F|nr:hypothetical protein NIES2098_30060 [Calothrix sp. NIES-2098]